jgi:hypothetical protein
MFLMMNYRHFFIGLLLLLTAFACTKRLSKSELADVLVDMYIYDQLYIHTDLRQQDSISVYRSVFQKHRCTEKQFQAGINYYGADPKYLREVYAEADIKIKALKQEYWEVVELQRKEKALERRMDSLYRYPSDTMYRHIFSRCLLWEPELIAERIAAVSDTTTVVFDSIETPIAVPSVPTFNRKLRKEATMDIIEAKATKTRRENVD